VCFRRLTRWCSTCTHSLITSTFEDAAGEGTRVTITWVPHENDEIGYQTFDVARPGMEGNSWGTVLKLDAHLQKLQG
jgi:hypothetical protein